MKRPKLIVILLASGILALITGSVIAASLPPQLSHRHSVTSAQAHRSARTSADPRSSGLTLPAGESAAFPLSKSTAANILQISRGRKHQVKHSITYVVKPLDTLSGIAAWFMLHGYGALYAANEDVIGSDPNLIFPGERITIINGVMKLSGPRS